MKRNALEEYKGYDIKGLREAIKKAKGEFADLMLDKNMSKLSDVKMVSKKRKDIAQLSTILRQKELVEIYAAKVEPKTETKDSAKEASEKGSK